LEVCFIVKRASRAHLKRLEGIAKEKGIELGPPMRASGSGKILKVKSEEEIYRHLDLQYVPPELREDAGEIEAAVSHSIPDDLVTIQDIKGMVHCHTTYSDGGNTIEEMALAAESMGMKVHHHHRSFAYGALCRWRQGRSIEKAMGGDGSGTGACGDKAVTRNRIRYSA
jgi:hypothetical protein